jgi:hypothetical protein
LHCMFWKKYSPLLLWVPTAPHACPIYQTQPNFVELYTWFELFYVSSNQHQALNTVSVIVKWLTLECKAVFKDETWTGAWELRTFLAVTLGERKWVSLRVDALNVCDYALSTLNILIIWAADDRSSISPDFTLTYKSHLTLLFSCMDSYS